MDSNWNSAYPYAVGPAFYGIKTALKDTSITEPVTQYIPSISSMNELQTDLNAIITYPNPASDLIAIQLNGLNRKDIPLQMFDLKGKLIMSSKIVQGSTIAFFDTRTIYNGEYLIAIGEENMRITKKVVVLH